MADGSIVYEVRVDSSNINPDLSRAGGLLEKGSQEITRLAANTALNFGKILGDVFGNTATQAEVAVSRLGASFNTLKDLAAPLLNALAPVTRELAEIAKISLPSLGEVTGKAAPVTTGGADSAGASSKGTGGIGGYLSQFMPSFATGTSYIPYDDFPALLHKGEAVLTASENAALKAAGGVGALGATPVQVFNPNSFKENDYGMRPVEVTLKIGDYEFTQVIADTMNNLYRQWGKNPLR
jgi:hypothetical protein